MYRTTELANFAGLANSTILVNLTILVILFWCFDWFDLRLGVTESWPRHRHLAVATSQTQMLYTTIRQSILLKTAFPARIDVATLIVQCFVQLLDSLFYSKLRSQLKLT